jgi:dephospho-CoA kinase
LCKPEVIKAIGDKFGSECITDCSVDRVRLGDIVFKDVEKLKALTDITFPIIISEIKYSIEQGKKFGCSTVVLDAPTLIESGLADVCDKIVFVRADREIRLSRIIARDDITRERALTRLSAEKTDDFYMAYADEVVDNN